jgi:hypothetical protein
LRKAKHLEEIWVSYFWRAEGKKMKEKDEEEKLSPKHMFYRVSHSDREEKQ